MPLNNVCFSQAVAGLDLEQALADCDASLKLDAANAFTLDSRAFVLMRLGRNKEALAAYDAALAARPDLADSLYGRGVVEWRLGLNDRADRDIAAAKAKDETVQKRFDGYGVTR